MSLQCAHVRVELSALLTRVLESVVDALLMAAQVALVRGLVAAPVAGILHPQVHPLPVLFHRLGVTHACLANSFYLLLRTVL